jgi:hypothetical protein
MMVSLPPLVVYLLFLSDKFLRNKGYIGISMMVNCVLCMTVTIINLKIKVIEVLKIFTILDAILAHLVIGSLSFAGFMYFLDKTQWEIMTLIATFVVAGSTKMLNIRVLLLHMLWSRNLVIVYKIGLQLMALVYFFFGVYWVYINYSFTYNMLGKFDRQCRHFVILFAFAAFDFCCMLLKAMGNFDYTDTLKY